MNTSFDLLVREAYLAHPKVHEEFPEMSGSSTPEEYAVYLRCVAFALGGVYPLDYRDTDGTRAWVALLNAVRDAFDEAAVQPGRTGLVLVRLIFTLKQLEATTV